MFGDLKAKNVCFFCLFVFFIEHAVIMTVLTVSFLVCLFKLAITSSKKVIVPDYTLHCLNYQEEEI